MLRLIKLDRSYDPETIAVMTAAFDTVCQSLSSRIRDDEHLQRTIALAILRLADQGVRDRCCSLMPLSVNWQVLPARQSDDRPTGKPCLPSVLCPPGRFKIRKKPTSLTGSLASATAFRPIQVLRSALPLQA